MELRDPGGDDSRSDAVVVGVVLVTAAGGAAAATQTDIATPLLTLIGALAVAVIAAVTAGRRQRREIAAARQRLRDQLDHDRRLRELEHLRTFFDEAAALFEDAENALIAHAVALEPDSGIDEEDYNRRFDQSYSAKNAIGVLAQRVELRFAEDHELTQAFMRLSGLIDDHHRFLARLDQGELTPALDKKDNEHRAKCRQAWMDCMPAARRFIAVYDPGQSDRFTR
jgi:hypothetical protein